MVEEEGKRSESVQAVFIEEADREGAFAKDVHVRGGEVAVSWPRAIA